MEAVIPLAVTMMVGPQIITAILLITAHDVVKPSLAFVAGVALAASLGTGLAFLIARLFGVSGGGGGGPSTAAKIVQTAIIALLIFLAVKTFINRAKVTLPKWMSKLESATAATAFKTGFLIIIFMPSDIAVMLTVGIHLASYSSPTVRFLPFIILTVLIAALPLILYLLLHRWAVAAMPKVRAWMESNSWVVSIAADLIFIALLW